MVRPLNRLGGLLLLLVVVWPAAGDDTAFEAARTLLENGEAERARAAFETLAGRGDPRAQDALAGMLVAGIGGPADRSEAMSWFCVLAHHPGGGRPVAHALWLLAEYFRTGGGLPGRRYRQGSRDRQDPLRAYFWFQIMKDQARHYAEVEPDAARLGTLGSDTTARELLAEEKERVARRLRQWSPDPRVARERCLRLPEK